MSEDVTIRVKEESQGNAVSATARRIEELKAKIAELNRLELAYTEKQMPTAAASTRTERIPYARELRDLQRQERAAEKEAALAAKATGAAEAAKAAEAKAAQLAVEKRIKAEQLEQLAVLRAQEAATAKRIAQLKTRLGNAAAGAVENVAGASGFGGVTNAVGAAGGPVGMVAAMAAIVGAAIASSVAKQNHQLAIIGMEDAAASRVQDRSLQRLAGFEGSSGSARERAASAKDEIIRREADRERLAEEAKPKWYSPSSWMKALTGENQNATIENENAITRKRNEEAAAKAIQREQFERDGAKELDITERRARGEMASAKSAEMALQYHREVVRLQKEGATNAEALRGADAKFSADIRDREQSVAGLINARTGAAAAARIASVAGRQFEGARDAVAAQKIEELTRVTREKADEAQATRTRPVFTSPPLHQRR